jgi:long-chain acyl-CoA synthetase
MQAAGTFGEYEWLSYNQVQETSQSIARGMKALNLVTETTGDGKSWKFVGIWCKNRAEWLMTHIANMYFNHTTIGFFDSMGVQAVDYILKQTELSCIFSTKDYIKNVIDMKKDNLAPTIKFLVCYDEITP